MISSRFVSRCLAPIAVVAGVWLLASATAFAAAPEAPQVKPATSVGSSSATLNGTLNPHSTGEPGGYQFIYRPSTRECEGEGEGFSDGGAMTGVQGQEVSGVATGLLPATEYAFCLVAYSDAGERLTSAPETFTTAPAAPLVGEESLAQDGSSEVTVGASIGGGGLVTGYHVEYGAGEGYEASTPEESLGAPSAQVGVRVKLTGLTAGATYHFRFSATNALGSMVGTDTAFVTEGALAAQSSSLPDGRVIELVSNPEDPGEVYTPLSPFATTEDIPASMPLRASLDGNAVVYGSDPPAFGGTGSVGRNGGDEFLARRGPTGWTSSDIAPIGTQTLAEEGYQAFSSDLSVGVAIASDRPPRVALTEDAPSNCKVLYLREDFTVVGENPYNALYTKAQVSGKCGGALFAGESADHSRTFFQDEAALIAGAEPAEGGGGEYCEMHCNLYESVNGQVKLVNVLPGGTADPNAAFGAASEDKDPPDFSNVVSTDGTRVFWTDLDTGVVYVRESAARTVPVSAGAAQFWTASPDGRYAFYTEAGVLWRFDVDRFDASSAPEPEALARAREEIVGNGASVQGVIGINETGEDGSYVYFVAAGDLASGAQARTCNTAGREFQEKLNQGGLTPEEAEKLGEEERLENRGRLPRERGCNLYLWHGGAISFIGAVSAKDNRGGGPEGLNGYDSFEGFGDLQASLGARTAEVSPDGRSLLFESKMAYGLVGYENDFEGRESQGNARLNVEKELFVFDSATDAISCVSCAPNGSAPRSTANQFGFESGTYLPVSGNATFMRRWMTADGSRVFFDSDQPLVSEDTNGLQDVYEWESEGTSDCPTVAPPRHDRGCVSLLSGGAGTDISSLLDASASGDDVFFTSRSRLSPLDRTEKVQLYDARVDGGFTEIEHACTGTGCQGVPPAPPIFATPASVTFVGVGNFEEPRKRAAVKPRRKPPKCHKGSVRRHGKCAKRASGKHGKRSSKGRGR